MIRSYRKHGAAGLEAREHLISDALWIDLDDPTDAELDEVSAAIGMPLPTREDMEEIELSSRLYREEGADFMTLVLPALSETDQHQLAPVTFALGGGRLVTIRYHDPRPFRSFPARAARSPYGIAGAHEILFGLFDAIIDRLADILEITDGRIDTVARTLFASPRMETPELRAAVTALGQAGTLVSDVRNSLVTVDRAILFLDRAPDDGPGGKRAHRSLRVLSNDATSLSEHANFMTQKLALIMDAAFNLTSIQQNAVSKTFSLVAVLFLPPTLIGTIFGMNFAQTPWIDWKWGFTASLLAMALSSLLSYLFFRWRSLL